MSVVRAGKNRRSLAFTVALAMLLALAVPFAGVALATHDTVTLDVTAETATNAAGSYHTLTATISGTASHAAEVDFEVDCNTDCTGASYTRLGTTGANTGPTTGGSVSAFDTPTDGDQTPETLDDTRASPELSCIIPVASTTCQVSYSRSDNGSDLVAGWVDLDQTNAAGDSDVAEGRDEATAPGNTTEADRTDVVAKTWFTAAATNVLLDCDDDDDTDTETNPPGQAEVYTCRAFNNNATAGTLTDDTAVSGVTIDAENIYTVQGATGANDGDNSGTAGTADHNNACTTGADGTCTFSFAPGEGETGSADLCFWIDEDNDTDFLPAGTDTFDGAACDTEAATGDEATTDDDTNKQDVVRKTWATPAATSLDATPERDSNIKGTAHTVSATVTSQFGEVMANIAVDFVVTGANAGAGCQNTLTNSSGVATCTYTDSTTVVGAEPETDTINVSVDGSGASDATVDEVDADLADRVEKFWFTTFPTPASVIVDMTSGDDCNDAADSTDSAEVEQNNDICGIVYAGPGATNPVAGQNVSLTVDGGSFFVNEGSTSGNTGTDRDDDTDLGQSITVTTASDGTWAATLSSLESGSDTVTATAGTATDTGTKTWTALTSQTAATETRTIDCSPETAENPPGTEHVIICSTHDRLGNPISGELITATESGPGRFENADVTNVATDASGEFEFIISTTETESGTQTVTVALDDDADDTTPLNRTDTTDVNDECDQAAANQTAPNSPDAPEGVCADQVTKDWVDAPEPGTTECSDLEDNDGDGNIDFGEDAGCSSAEDDSEVSETPRPCRDRGGENVIVGTSGADVLTGTADRDIICGAGGDDVISAKGGADLVVGNGGGDTIGGGGGKDNLSGNGDNDSVSGGKGNDALKGQAGNDTLKGNDGIDSLTGGKGADSLQGGNKGDIVKGGAGNDSLRGGKGADLLDGGDGNDGCFGGPGDDKIKNCE